MGKIVNFFVDTEFNERGHKYPVELISIGIVSEYGKEFYCVVRDEDFSKSTCNAWVQKHVFPKIENEPRTERDLISSMIEEFVGPDVYPVFWFYYGATDQSVFKQLFKGYPRTWPKYFCELLQMRAQLNWPKLPKKPAADQSHHALVDAKWLRDAWFSMREVEKEQKPIHETS